MKRTMTIILVAAVALFCIPACSEYTEGLLGDLNGDGHLTQKDIQLLENLINEGSHNEKGDLNDDGRVDDDDLDELKDKVCDANGASSNDLGDCCFTSDDNTVCCDQDYDGDFEECTPPNIDCEVDADCALDCPAACVNGKCRCIGACDSDDDCFPLNCPAFCNDLGTCECKVFCEQDDDCAFISRCRSACGNAGYCVCDDDCLGQGERFMGDPQNYDCCPGLEPIVYAEYISGECAYVDCPCFVCAACGNDACEDGENPCNCREDCTTQCLPGEEKLFECPDGTRVPWCTCGDSGDWYCITSPEMACMECVPGEERLFECPDGTLVPWCTCGDSGAFYCITSPEMACEQSHCLVEGERFEGFQADNPCCPGLVPVPDHFPNNGTCVGPNCPCFICTRCGTDAGVCSLGENRCNCPEDCVTSQNCTADDCTMVAGLYVVAGGDCPGIGNDPRMYEITQVPGCGSMDAELSGGMCDTGWGWKWDGSECVYLGGRCGCDGDDCESLFQSQTECNSAYAHCVPENSCDPMDAEFEEFLCDTARGWKWDGAKCVCGDGACICTGADCENLYQSEDECRLAHAHCNGQPCSLGFNGLIEDLLGSQGCIDHDIIFTSRRCTGTVSISGTSRTMYFTCPWANDNDSQSSCTVYLDDMID